MTGLISPDAVCIAFSKDRAMQLDATLRSLAESCEGLGQLRVVVLYRATAESSRRQYHELTISHSDVSFVEETNFNDDVRKYFEEFRFVFFLVDDTFFTGPWNFSRVRDLLIADDDIIGVSLRLGENVTWCYTLNEPQTVPPYSILSGGLISFRYAEGSGDFGYPLEVSSSVFRTEDIRRAIDGFEIPNPNQLESILSGNIGSLAYRPLLAAFSQSIAFANPVNVVQQEFPNRYAQNTGLSAAKLSRLFDAGMRIDLDPYRGHIASSCHEELPLRFLYPWVGGVHGDINLAMRVPNGGAAWRDIALNGAIDWTLPEAPSSSDLDVLYTIGLLARLSADSGNWLISLSKAINEQWHALNLTVESRERASSRWRDQLTQQMNTYLEELENYRSAINNYKSLETEAVVWRNNLEQAIAEQNVELEKFRQYTKEGDAWRDELAKTLAQQNAELIELRRSHHELKRIIDVGANEIGERRERMRNLQRDFDGIWAELQAAIVTVSSLEEEKRLISAQLQISMASAVGLSDERTQLLAQLREATAMASHFQHSMNLLLDSNSWRATKPLRFATRTAGRILYRLCGIRSRKPELVAPSSSGSIDTQTDQGGGYALSAAMENPVEFSNVPSVDGSPNPENFSAVDAAPKVSILQIAADGISQERWQGQTLSSVEFLGTAASDEEVASCLAAIKGRYLLVLKGAAILEPTALERMVLALAKDPHRSVIVARKTAENSSDPDSPTIDDRRDSSWAVMTRAAALPQVAIDEIADGRFAFALQTGSSQPTMSHIFGGPDIGAATSLAAIAPKPKSSRGKRSSAVTSAQPVERTPILVIVPFLPVGGAESLLYRIIAGLIDDYEFMIVTTLPERHAWHDRFAGIVSSIYHLPDFLPPDQWIGFLLGKISERKIGKLLVSGSQYGYNFIPHAKTAFPTIQTYCLLHNDEWAGHRANALDVGNSIDHFIAISKRIGATLLYLDRINAERVKTICNGVDVEERFSPSLVAHSASRQRFGLPVDRQLIAFVGRLSPEKDPDAFLDIVARCPQSDEVAFAVFGHGPLDRQINERISSLGEMHTIFRIPYVVPEMMPELFAAIDLLVITSKSEGLPLVLLEAMAMEVPAVACDVGDIASALESGVSGVVVTAGDIDALSEAVQHLIANVDRRIEMGKAARRRLIELGLTERHMLAEYRSLLSGKKAGLDADLKREESFA